MSEQIGGASPEECFEQWWHESEGGFLIGDLPETIRATIHHLCRLSFLEGGRQQEVRQLAPVDGANYMRVVEQTDEEKIAMYMKQPKHKLAEMLVSCNKHFDKFVPVVAPIIDGSTDYCQNCGRDDVARIDLKLHSGTSVQYAHYCKFCGSFF